MLEELNNILDRTNNWIVFEEARNSGLIALNLGLISFVFGSGLSFQKILLILCVMSIMVSTYSFIGKKVPLFLGKTNEKTKENDDSQDLIIQQQEKKDQKSLFDESRVVITRNKRNDIFDKKDLQKYNDKNIYCYRDVAEIDEETLLRLVHHRLLMRNENEEYPIHISKDYHFKLAHKDLSKMIYENSVICLVKSKCFFISLGLFIINVGLMGIFFLIHS